MSSSAFSMLDKELQNKIISRLGWNSLTPVQEAAIPEILKRKNIIILAPTAGGKTESCFFPVLSLMNKNKLDGLRCIYITPIKALLNNQESRIMQLSEFLDFDIFKWHGDVSRNNKEKFYANPTNILMITPESLEVIMANNSLNKYELLENLEYIIIDEIHSFANKDRGAQLISLIERMDSYTKVQLQRIGLSATVGNPIEILEWLHGGSDREKIIVKPKNSKTQRMIEIKWCGDNIENETKEIYKRVLGRKSLVFANSRKKCEELNFQLKEKGIDSLIHHSSINKEKRELTEDYFKTGTNRTIVATNTLELGIDIGGLDIVLHYDSPNTVSSFLQKMGRTGRRKNTKPWFVFLPTDKYKLITSIAIVSLAIEGWVESSRINKKNYSTLVHQLILIVYSGNGINHLEIFKILKNCYSFLSIELEDYNNIIKHLEKIEVLDISMGKLYLGNKIEIDYGTKNYMEIYSTFITSDMYLVKNGFETVGELDLSASYNLKIGNTFLLAGNSWLISKIDKEQKIFYVIKQKKAAAPNWKSPNGNLSFEIVQRIEKLLYKKIEFDYLEDFERKIFNQYQDDEISQNIAYNHINIIEHGKKLLIYTYGGLCVNKSFWLLLESINAEISNLGASINDFCIEIKIEIANLEIVQNIIKFIFEIKSSPKEIIASNREIIMNLIKDHKGAQFSEYLPKKYASEEVFFEVFDFENLENLFLKEIKVIKID